MNSMRSTLLYLYLPATTIQAILQKATLLEELVNAICQGGLRSYQVVNAIDCKRKNDPIKRGPLNDGCDVV